VRLLPEGLASVGTATIAIEMNTEPDSLKGLLYSLAGTMAFAGGLVASKHALDGFNPYTFCIVLSVSAGIWTLLIALITGKGRSLVVRRARAWRRLLLLGLITGVPMIAGSSAMKMLDPSFVAFLGKLQPVFVIMMGAVILHEKVLYKELLAAGIMLAGACISVIGRWHIVGTGTILILLTCLLGACQLLIGKIEAGVIPALALVFYRVAASAVIVTVWALLTAGVDFNVEVSYWFSAVLAAFFGPCVGLLLMFQSYRYWHLSRSSMVHTALPVVVLPVAWLFLDKVPVARELAGGAVILLGAFALAWIQLTRRRTA